MTQKKVKKTYRILKFVLMKYEGVRTSVILTIIQGQTDTQINEERQERFKTTNFMSSNETMHSTDNSEK